MDPLIAFREPIADPAPAPDDAVASVSHLPTRPRLDSACDADGLPMVQRWMAAVGGKWSLPVLDQLADRPSRYNSLLAGLDSIAPKVLTQTLRRLETEGFVSSEPVGKIGRRYSLTRRGALLREQLLPLRRWAAQEASRGASAGG